MKKVALFGGAFNPPTLGHKEIVEQVLCANVVDEVWITPAYISMTGKKMESFDDRVNLCKLTFQSIEGAVVSTFEKDYKNQGSVELLKALFNDNKDIEFYFIMGLDNANVVLTEWKRGQELIDIVNVIVLDRKGVKKTGTEWYDKKPHVYLKDIEIREISSTDVRNILVNPHPTNDDIVFIIENMEKSTIHYIGIHRLYM